MTDVERSEFEIHDVESEPSEFVLRSRRTLLPHGEAHCCCDALVVVRDATAPPVAPPAEAATAPQRITGVFRERPIGEALKAPAWCAHVLEPR